MKNTILNSCGKSFLIGLSFGIGMLTTAAIGVTVNAVFENGSILDADDLNELKAIIESFPGWEEGTNSGDAVYTAGNVGVGTDAPSFYDGTGIHIENTNGATEMNATLVLENQNSSWELLGGSGPDDNGFGIYESTSGNEGYRLFIDSPTANVGIGTTQPEKKLHLFGDKSTGLGIQLENDYLTTGRKWRVNSHGDTGQFRIKDETAGTNRLVIEPNGDVGIGTTTPGAKLEVDGDIIMNGHLSRNDSTFLQIRNDSSIRPIIITPGSDSYLRIDAGGSEAVRVESNGNVGIGTTSPNTRLDVSGDVSVSGIIETTSGGIKFPDGTTQTTAAGGDAPIILLSGCMTMVVSSSYYLNPGSCSQGTSQLIIDSQQMIMPRAGTISNFTALVSGSTAGGSVLTVLKNDVTSDIQFNVTSDGVATDVDIVSFAKNDILKVVITTDGSFGGGSLVNSVSFEYQ